MRISSNGIFRIFANTSPMQTSTGSHLRCPRASGAPLELTVLELTVRRAKDVSHRGPSKAVTGDVGLSTNISGNAPNWAYALTTGHYLLVTVRGLLAKLI